MRAPSAGALDLFDSRFGPFLDLACHRLSFAGARWWLFSSAHARHPLGSILPRIPATSAGVARDRGIALRRALGESLERYASLNPAVETHGPIPLDECAVWPLFPRPGAGEILLDDSGAPARSGANRVSCTGMVDVVTGGEVEVPAAFVFPAYSGATTDRCRRRPSSRWCSP